VNGGSRVTQVSAEFLGTATLALAIVGSGAHASTLANSEGLALLINAAVTGAVLAVLIATLLPISGAHFNPAVTLVMLMRKEIAGGRAGSFVAAQVAGAVVGTVLAHWLFTSSGPVISDMERIGVNTFVAEVISTTGLLFIIVTAVMRDALHYLPGWVALWIGAGYFVTPSTGFANPAITVGRMFTDTFTGIEPLSAVWFIGAQIVGALAGSGLAMALHKGLKQVGKTT
jgi:glycerol uptake facilitator-like aquaporin